MLDSAVFKILAHNDTGRAKGHQGGLVIPKELASFFPPLPGNVSDSEPTVDVRISADLFVDGLKVATVETRYQHQTWGGTRSPERRLTDNLGPLRNVAEAGDIALFRKDLFNDHYLQIHLLKAGSPEYIELQEQVGSRRWGIVDHRDPPVSLSEMSEADIQIETEAGTKPYVFSDEKRVSEVRSVRKARDRSFRNKVLGQYDFRCAFSNRSYASPLHPNEFGLDAAHVVPVAENGSDHPANGLPLSKDLHWAFDRGLIGVGENRCIFVSESVQALHGNEFLASLSGVRIREAASPRLRVLDEAFEWHRANRLIC